MKLFKQGKKIHFRKLQILQKKRFTQKSLILPFPPKKRKEKKTIKSSTWTYISAGNFKSSNSQATGGGVDVEDSN